MYLGVDLGTSGVKAVLVDAAQTVRATATAPLAVSRPRPGWSEQDPDDWWAAVGHALDALAAQDPAGMAAVRGIGLSGQMHGATLLDRDHRVLRPCILWDDGRSTAECRDLEAAWPDLRRVTGNRAMPGFTAPKLAWVRRHEPDIFERTALVLLPKAWLRLALTGEAAEEMSDASGTLWLDTGARAWSDAALTASGLDRSHMPRLTEGTAPAGTLRPALARRWGMDRPPVVAGGAGDNAAGAVGLGAVRPGDAFVSLGTSGVLWATTAAFAPAPDAGVHAFCHAVPGTWHQMGVILAAASALSWWAGICGRDEAALLAELGDAPTGPGRVRFVPYITGNRTPHDDAGARGTFHRIDAADGRADLTRAVLEGVAFAIADCRDALAAAGTPIATADVIGGGARSALWTAILADVLGLPLRRPTGGETGAAFGAARLGRIAATGEAPAAVCLPPAQGTVTAPDHARHAAYADAQADWRRTYATLRAG